VYGRKITKADKVERFVGKTCILGLGYGMGAEKFRRTLEIGQGGISVKLDLKEAEHIVRLYRAKNTKIVELWNKCGHALKCIMAGREYQIGPTTVDGMGIKLPNGLYIQYPMLRAKTSGFEYVNDARQYRSITETNANSSAWTKIYSGKVTENIVQGLAALAIREQSLAIGKKLHVVFQVHDEIVAASPNETAADAEKYVIQCMTTPPVWAQDLPIACESGMADNYGDT
jgi:DNA polymerase bacteriophage-type